MADDAIPPLFDEKGKRREWQAGDPCNVCGSTNTGEDIVEGGFCNDCGSSDADE